MYAPIAQSRCFVLPVSCISILTVDAVNAGVEVALVFLRFLHVGPHKKGERTNLAIKNLGRRISGYDGSADSERLWYYE